LFLEVKEVKIDQKYLVKNIPNTRWY